MDSLENWLDFRRGEIVREESCPCWDCGQESDCFAEFTENGVGTGEFICEECCNRDEEL